jgi:hypothetical protein
MVLECSGNKANVRGGLRATTRKTRGGARALWSSNLAEEYNSALRHQE